MFLFGDVTQTTGVPWHPDSFGMALAATVVFYRSILDKAPYQRPEAVQTVLDDAAESDPRAATIRPEELINTDALAQLDREGFLKQLYAAEAR